jgi:putative tryptophan/tyrosine transport system substrate-binding protein
MRRREFIAGLSGTVVWPLAARAQQANRMPRIGALFMFPKDDPTQTAWIAAWREGLEKLGWINGRNVAIDFHYGSGDPEQALIEAQQMVRSAPDVILASTTPGLVAARQATATIPIVFAFAGDPLSQGLVPSLANPDGNITGFSSTEDATWGKLVELLKEADSRLLRVLAVADPNEPTNATRFLAVQAAAASFKLPLTRVDVQTEAEFEGAVAQFASEPDGGLILMGSVTFLEFHFLNSIAATVAKHRLPAIYAYRMFATNGGLLSYGADQLDIHRRAASYVDRILRGTKVADLPVQFATKFELVINLKTAKALGLAIPESFLLRADEVIE